MIRDFPKGVTNTPKIKFNYVLLDFFLITMLLITEISNFVE